MSKFDVFNDNKIDLIPRPDVFSSVMGFFQMVHVDHHLRSVWYTDAFDASELNICCPVGIHNNTHGSIELRSSFIPHRTPFMTPTLMSVNIRSLLAYKGSSNDMGIRLSVEGLDYRVKVIDEFSCHFDPENDSIVLRRPHE